MMKNAALYGGGVRMGGGRSRGQAFETTGTLGSSPSTSTTG